MTDYFALLDQPRRPWLDLEQLKGTFHAKTLRAHPDAQSHSGTPSDGAFTELNEAYQVLRDPKRRLHHLLTLEGIPPSSRSTAVPKEIEDLFSVVAGLSQESADLVQKLVGARSALSRSLLRSDLMSMRLRVSEVTQILKGVYERANGQLQSANKPDEVALSEARMTNLHALYLQFSYLTKWIVQLEEKQLQLTL